ncbi:MAG: helix-turn-helix domain-containing protein [Gammaproteobacteria bacterium]|nr:helix-turn-helix domain-containing protein [Gammaproteobacteria bacterium]
MILQQVLGLLRERGVAGVNEIAAVVGSDPAVVRDMLATLQRRGLVERHQPPQGCGSSCRQCAQADIESYCLVGRDRRLANPGCVVSGGTGKAGADA